VRDEELSSWSEHGWCVHPDDGIDYGSDDRESVLPSRYLNPGDVNAREPGANRRGCPVWCPCLEENGGRVMAQEMDEEWEELE